MRCAAGQECRSRRGGPAQGQPAPATGGSWAPPPPCHAAGGSPQLMGWGAMQPAPGGEGRPPSMEVLQAAGGRGSGAHGTARRGLTACGTWPGLGTCKGRGDYNWLLGASDLEQAGGERGRAAWPGEQGRRQGGCGRVRWGWGGGGVERGCAEASSSRRMCRHCRWNRVEPGPSGLRPFSTTPVVNRHGCGLERPLHAVQCMRAGGANGGRRAAAAGACAPAISGKEVSFPGGYIRIVFVTAHVPMRRGRLPGAARERRCARRRRRRRRRR